MSAAHDVPVAHDAEHPRGVYMGVTPGGPEKPPVPATPNSTPAIVTWPGFQMRADGSSRVFVQTTTPVTVTPSQKGNLLTIDLGGARVNAETNAFALYTRFFNTPVVRAQIKGVGKKSVLEIELRASVQPIISSEQAKSGFFFIYVDFPAGDYLPKGGAPVPAPPGTPAPAGKRAGEPEAPAHLDEAPPAPPEPPAPKAKASGQFKAGIKL